LSLPGHAFGNLLLLSFSLGRVLVDNDTSNTLRASLRHPLSEPTDSLLPCPLALRRALLPLTHLCSPASLLVPFLLAALAAPNRQSARHVSAELDLEP
jgi:hypothetical protein